MYAKQNSIWCLHPGKMMGFKADIRACGRAGKFHVWMWAMFSVWLPQNYSSLSVTLCLVLVLKNLPVAPCSNWNRLTQSDTPNLILFEEYYQVLQDTDFLQKHYKTDTHTRWKMPWLNEGMVMMMKMTWSTRKCGWLTGGVPRRENMWSMKRQRQMRGEKIRGHDVDNP